MRRGDPDGAVTPRYRAESTAWGNTRSLRVLTDRVEPARSVGECLLLVPRLAFLAAEQPVLVLPTEVTVLPVRGRRLVGGGVGDGRDCIGKNPCRRDLSLSPV